MATITIRRLDEATKGRLRTRAARHGQSMEAEAREILRCALAKQKASRQNLADALHARFAPLGGLDLPKIPREPGREPPNFSE
jgi:plasmid stability protein